MAACNCTRATQGYSYSTLMYLSYASGYMQGTKDSCHALAKLWAYKKSHALTKEQLKEQMAPLLAAEKAEQLIAAGVQLGSTLCAASAAAASAAVAETGEGPGEAVAGSAEAVKGTVSQLLSNLERLQHFHDSCLREEGFKQVSFGALQLYHDHDKEMKKHHIKAHCIIKESVVVRGPGFRVGGPAPQAGRWACKTLNNCFNAGQQQWTD